MDSRITTLAHTMAGVSIEEQEHWTAASSLVDRPLRVMGSTFHGTGAWVDPGFGSHTVKDPLGRSPTLHLHCDCNEVLELKFQDDNILFRVLTHVGVSCASHNASSCASCQGIPYQELGLKNAIVPELLSSVEPIITSAPLPRQLNMWYESLNVVKMKYHCELCGKVTYLAWVPEFGWCNRIF